MIRLWRYWPVRVLCLLGLGWAVITLPVFAIRNIGFVADMPFPVIMIVLIAFAAGTGSLVAKFERKPGIEPMNSRRMSGPVTFVAIMGITAPGLLALILSGALEGQLTPPSSLARAYVALVAAVMPLVIAGYSRPRNGLHWAALVLCIPAMYVASLASLPASALVLSAVFPAPPDAATVYAVLAGTLIALNVLPVALLLLSGACPLELNPVRRSAAS